jgi:hypothetical protein
MALFCALTVRCPARAPYKQDNVGVFFIRCTQSPREHIPFLNFVDVLEPEIILVLERVLVPCLFYFRAETLGRIREDTMGWGRGPSPFPLPRRTLA